MGFLPAGLTPVLMFPEPSVRYMRFLTTSFVLTPPCRQFRLRRTSVPTCEWFVALQFDFEDGTSFEAKA